MTGICWHDRPRWGCRHDFGSEAYIRWGRCRTGRRWFWTAAEVLWEATAAEIDAAATHGTASTEAEAVAAAREAVALVSARIHGIPSPAPGLSGDVPAEDVAAALAALCAGLLRAYYPDGGAYFLRQAGAGALHPETGEGGP